MTFRSLAVYALLVQSLFCNMPLRADVCSETPTDHPAWIKVAVESGTESVTFFYCSDKDEASCSLLGGRSYSFEELDEKAILEGAKTIGSATIDVALIALAVYTIKVWILPAIAGGTEVAVGNALGLFNNPVVKAIAGTTVFSFTAAAAYTVYSWLNPWEHYQDWTAISEGIHESECYKTNDIPYYRARLEKVLSEM